MNRKRLVTAAMGLAALLFMAAAMAQQNPYTQSSKNRPRVMINGKENADLSNKSVNRGGKVMVPDQQFFKAVGSDVNRRQGWVRPGSQHPDQDRAEQWNVTQRNGRELRYRAGDRQYYYGGVPHYWSVAPYESDGGVYLSIGDLALTLGGRYNYNDTYNSGQVTLCEGGYCPAPGTLQMTYPYGNSYYANQSQAVVQGYAPPGTLVRVQVIREMPFPFQNHTEYNQNTRANRNGLFSVAVYLSNTGAYVANADLLDDYGRILSRQTSRFFVR